MTERSQALRAVETPIGPLPPPVLGLPKDMLEVPL
jgi:hypothetical protein